jgi:hypothetical protein
MTTENKTQKEKGQKQEKKRPIDIARENLKLLSLEVKDLVEDGTFFTINDAIMETLYKNETHKEFKSYRQWKNEGYQVNKGEKAFLLWAKPKQINKPMEENPTDEEWEEMLKFFPIAYLFSNAQVTEIGEENREEAKEVPKQEKETINQETEQEEPLKKKPEKISLTPLEL